jgi:hypothetical protein
MADRGDGRYHHLRDTDPPGGSHSRESGNSPPSGLTWTPAYAGVTTPAIFIPLGGPQAHEHSE